MLAMTVRSRDHFSSRPAIAGRGHRRPSAAVIKQSPTQSVGYGTYAVGGAATRKTVLTRKRSDGARAPSTTLRVVPLPRSAGADEAHRSRGPAHPPTDPKPPSLNSSPPAL